MFIETRYDPARYKLCTMQISDNEDDDDEEEEEDEEDEVPMAPPSSPLLHSDFRWFSLLPPQFSVERAHASL